jgi:hypothetical protein
MKYGRADERNFVPDIDLPSSHASLVRSIASADLSKKAQASGEGDFP